MWVCRILQEAVDSFSIVLLSCEKFAPWAKGIHIAPDDCIIRVHVERHACLMLFSEVGMPASDLIQERMRPIFRSVLMAVGPNSYLSLSAFPLA